LKIVISEVPTEKGHYADYKLIALFDKAIAYLEGGSEIWKYMVTLTISATHAAVQDDGIVMPLSMAASFMRWMKDDARTAGMPQRMVTFWIFFCFAAYIVTESLK
jgi:hypothetical protein